MRGRRSVTDSRSQVQLRSGERAVDKPSCARSFVAHRLVRPLPFLPKLSSPLFFFPPSWPLLPQSCLSVCREVHTHRAAWPGSTSAGGDGGHPPKTTPSLLLTSHSPCPLCFSWLSNRPHSISGFTHAPSSQSSSFFTLFLNFPPGLPKTKRRSCRGLTPRPLPYNESERV